MRMSSEQLNALGFNPDGTRRKKPDGSWDRPFPSSMETPTTSIAPKPSGYISQVVISRNTTAEDRLNKTERRWLAVLRSRNYQFVGIQCLTLRLGFNLRYTPDFMTLDESGLTLFDAKGKHIWEDSAVKIKACAAAFPFFKFVVAQWKDNQWTEKVIKP